MAKSQQPESIATSKAKRATKKGARLTNMVTYAFPIIGDDILSTYKVAIQSLYWKNWQITMGEETKSLHKN